MFQAGFARVDITPHLGCPLAGYFVVRYADKILDSMQLNALAVRDDESTAVYVAGDVIAIRLPEANQLRARISERFGIPVENVFLQALHQHTSFRIGATPKEDHMKDPAFLDVLYRKYLDVVQMALDDLAEAQVSVADKETAEPVSFVRRFRMKDGSTRTNPGCLNPDIDGPIGDADNTVRRVKFEREGKKTIALVHFSTHPDVIGGNNLSADWPGFVRRMTENEIPETLCILVNGFQGDVNHVDVKKPTIAVKEDPQFFEKRYAYSERMGRIITDTVKEIWNETAEKKATPIACYGTVEYIPTNTKFMDEIDRFRQMKKDFDAKLIKLTMGPRAEMNRVLNLPEQTLFQKMPVSILGMGEIAIVGLGGEPFTWYGVKAREAAPELYLLPACLVNGAQGYLPSKDAFAEGGYEAMGSSFTVSLADKVPAAVAGMLNEHKEKLK